MAGCLIETGDEGVTLSGGAVKRLLEKGDGDAALLYLALLRRYPAGQAPLLYQSGPYQFAICYLSEPAGIAAPENGLLSGDNDGGVILTTWNSMEKVAL